MRFLTVTTAALLLGLAGMAGCDGGGEACDDAGATRCFDGAAEECSGGAWEILDDCDANGQSCMQDDSMMAGEAHCM
jgi:hypothetical protein